MVMQFTKLPVEQCELFHDLPASMTDRVRDLVSEREFGPNQTIFVEGDAAREIFILASGEVELSYTLPTHSEISLPISKVDPGQLFGWSAAAGGQHLTAKAHTAADSVVYVIPADRFQQLCDDDPAAGYVVMRRLLKLARLRLRDTRFQLRWMQNYC